MGSPVTREFWIGKRRVASVDICRLPRLVVRLGVMLGLIRPMEELVCVQSDISKATKSWAKAIERIVTRDA